MVVSASKKTTKGPFCCQCKKRVNSGPNSGFCSGINGFVARKKKACELFDQRPGTK